MAREKDSARFSGRITNIRHPVFGETLAEQKETIAAIMRSCIESSEGDDISGDIVADDGAVIGVFSVTWKYPRKGERKSDQGVGFLRCGEKTVPVIF